VRGPRLGRYHQGKETTRSSPAVGVVDQRVGAEVLNDPS
jgi:hypothetical protein